MAVIQSSSTTTSIQDRTMIINRVYQAPVEYVYKAWTDPKHLVSWWGPAGFRTTIKTFDLRPGGSWIYIMHGPEGTDYDNVITYQEIVENERLVYAHGDSADPAWFNTTVTFIGQGNTTQLTMQTTFKSLEELEKSVREYGALEGAVSTLARLENQLPMVQFHQVRESEFTIERVLNAPRELVYAAFTEAEHLAQWWGPQGWTMPVCDMDLRTGGRWHYCMRSPDGDMESWGISIFQEIDPPEKIVQIDSFSDDSGQVNDSLPSMTITTSFIDLGNSRTQIICTTVYATADDLKSVIEMGMLQGLTESWNRLVEHLNTVQE